MTASWFRDVKCDSDDCVYCLACSINDLPAYTNAHLQESQRSGMDECNSGKDVA